MKVCLKTILCIGLCAVLVNSQRSNTTSGGNADFDGTPPSNSENDFYPTRNESSECGECVCGLTRLLCPPGISTLLDGCGCCHMCARQLGQACDTRNVCDHHKGLYCHEISRTCKASPGRSCLVGGKWYDNGAVFKPSCKATCSCINGDIGCSPTCLADLRSPPLLSCRNPRLLRRKDQCCPEWRCVGDDELDQYERIGNQAGRAKAIKVVLKGKCLVQTSDWSECPKSCGFGISYRVTNDNPDCNFKKETRLCKLRPCDMRPNGKRSCRKTVKHKNRVRFSLSGCVSASIYRLKYCGVCAGKCCRPSKTKTASVQFQCKEGEHSFSTFERKIMLIRRCSCDNRSCKADDLAGLFGGGRGLDSDTWRPS